VDCTPLPRPSSISSQERVVMATIPVRLWRDAGHQRFVLRRILFVCFLVLTDQTFLTNDKETLMILKYRIQQLAPSPGPSHYRFCPMACIETRDFYDIAASSLLHGISIIITGKFSCSNSVTTYSELMHAVQIQYTQWDRQNAGMWDLKLSRRVNVLNLLGWSAGWSAETLAQRSVGNHVSK
jgi:hypothetical protein